MWLTFCTNPEISQVAVVVQGCLNFLSFSPFSCKHFCDDDILDAVKRYHHLREHKKRLPYTQTLASMENLYLFVPWAIAELPRARRTEAKLTPHTGLFFWGMTVTFRGFFSGVEIQWGTGDPCWKRAWGKDKQSEDLSNAQVDYFRRTRWRHSQMEIPPLKSPSLLIGYLILFVVEKF